MTPNAGQRRASALRHGAARALPLVRKVVAVAGAQLITQVIGLLCGFLLLRWLDLKQYAEYTFAFAFGSSMSQLIDLGFADSMLGVIGERANESQVVGGVMRAAMSLRWGMCAIVLPGCAIPFFILVDNRHWGIETGIALFASVVITLIGRTMADYYTLPLIIDQAFRPMYAAQIAGSAFRLLMTLVLRVVSVLDGWIAAAVNATSLVVIGSGTKRIAASHYEEPGEDSPQSEYRRNILRVVWPMMPGQVFYAFQGQIIVFIAATIGGTTDLAQVGALTRLAQLFVVANIIIAYVFVPRVARAAAVNILRVTGEVVVITVFILGAGVALVFLVPGPVLWFLGGHYHNLRVAAGWYVVSSCIDVLNGMMYGICLARRFIWLTATVVQVCAMIATEVGAAFLFNLSNIVQLQYFAAASATAALIIQCSAFAFGMRQMKRRARLGEVEASDEPAVDR